MMHTLSVAYRREVITEVELPLSKSESNRLLIIWALNNKWFQLPAISSAADTRELLNAIEVVSTGEKFINSGEGGTTFRFLLSYLSYIKGDFLLSASGSMANRPIENLVNALNELGAEIDYTSKKGFSPVKIRGGALRGKRILLDAGISSQFISSLLLISPMLSNGIEICLKGNPVSLSYIQMTIEMMKRFGAEVNVSGNIIAVKEKPYDCIDNCSIEADWSAASYWYSIAVLLDGSEIKLKGLKKDSIQGDSVIQEIFTHFGVQSNFFDNTVVISKTKENEIAGIWEYDFSSCPDLVLTMAVLCSALRLKVKFNGIKTLRIKETDRISAIVEELKKFNVKAYTSEDCLEIDAGEFTSVFVTVNTYNDHRMAMAFAPLVFLCGKLSINNPEVVIKSYPGFWNDLRSAGVDISN